MIESAKIHIYHGDGKGKTTAAVGLCARAVGRGNRVLFCSFLKDGTSGEVKSLNILGVDTRFLSTPGFTWQLDERQTEELKTRIGEFFSKIKQKSSDYDLIVLDEVLDAVNEKLLPEAEVIDFLRKNRETEIVLTGRGPSETLVEKADYVTEMKLCKHPFNQGVAAREGVES